MTKVKKKTVTGTVELNEEDLKEVTGGSSILTSAGTEKERTAKRVGGFTWDIEPNKSQ